MEELNYLQLIKEFRKIKDNFQGYPEVKIAILGDNSTQQLTQVLKAYLHRNKIFVRVYEADFDVLDQEIYDAGSGFYQFAPEYVVLFTSVQRLREDFYRGGQGDVEGFKEKALGRLKSFWDKINQNISCRIIQNIYVVPTERILGNYTAKLNDAFSNIVQSLNQQLKEEAKDRNNIFLNDMEYLASWIGKKHFNDEKFWIHAKMICSPDDLPQIIQNIAQIILAGAGRSKKCLVLDLDQTLWGGTIGDDGLEGIELGEQGAGEAFVLFQRYLRDLKNRGIILAVCSKNNHETAREPFLKHSDMVLREEDISVFVANWDHKVDNIRLIANVLNIGMDAMVFLDDSAFERNQVRAMLPAICVPEMPEDPAQYVNFLNSLNLFETLSSSREDQTRTRFYREEILREKEKQTFSDIKDYLKSLQMKASFARFDPFHLPRVAQLIQRSNQFNLTTRRYNEKECESFMNNVEDCEPFYVTLEDKFGDHGLIGVIILKIETETMVIDQWLMSCRVLQRGVEQFCMNQVATCARRRDCRAIEGRYIPTAKNKMVANFYATFGFEKIRENKDGEVSFRLGVLDYAPRETFIDLAKEEPWPAGRS